MKNRKIIVILVLGSLNLLSFNIYGTQLHINMLKNHFISAGLCCLLIIQLDSCTRQHIENQSDPSTEVKQIEKVIHHSIGWAKNKDFQLLYNTIANDSDYIEVDPGPGLIKGIDEFRNFSPEFRRHHRAGSEIDHSGDFIFQVVHPALRIRSDGRSGWKSPQATKRR